MNNLTRFSVVLMVVMIKLNALADEQGFVYDGKNKRDPFDPVVSAGGLVITSESDLTVGDLSLEGVLVDASGKNVAIINGRVVSVGDAIGGYVIKSVDAQGVVITQEGKEMLLKLKGGGS